MQTKQTPITPELAEYLSRVSLREPEILRRLREETAAHPRSSMQISAEQGQFMAMLIRLLGATRTLEIGVFTGYSSLSVALALPANGHITACDVSEEYTDIARRYWREAGVEHKIDLRIAPAKETLEELLAEGEAGHLDFAFIDADKANYAHYYDRALRLIRPGGLIAVDNVLWHGDIDNPAHSDADTLALRAFNLALLGDDRIWLSMLPIADGLTLAVRK